MTQSHVCIDSTTTQPFGQRLLPTVVDDHAARDPSRVYGSYAVSNDISDGFRQVTMVQMANAINFVAWWIKEKIGTSSTFETIAYMGASDFRYPILIVAAIKCGFKVLLPGTRNSTVQIVGLLQRTKCKALFYSAEVRLLVDQLAIRSTFKIASLEEIVAAEADHFPYDKVFADVVDDPILVVHSSGTTGNPKIVTMTHGTVSVTDNDRYVTCPVTRKPQNGAQFNFKDGGGFYSCFPPYHLAGLQAFLILPIFSSKASIIAGPPLLPPSGDLLSSILRSQLGFLRAFYVPPSLIDQWAQLPGSTEHAKELDFILYGGGPLPNSVGEELSRLTDVCQMYGSVETGQIQLLVPQKGKDDWAYMEWNPCEEVDMQPSIEGTHELVLHQESKFRQHRSLSHNFPDLKEWRSGDLFIPHPSKAGLWRYHGRIDDLIVLANSHKINPVAFETSIQSHPAVSAALMVGTGRVQPALLIELVPAIMVTNKLKDNIWQLVEQANALVPQYGRIIRSMMMFGDPAKPFPRAPKGSVIRKATLAAYALEIREAYIGTHQLPELDTRSLGSITSWIRKLVCHVLPDVDWRDDGDLFHNGMDSLKVAEYVTLLKRALGRTSRSGSSISNQLIYRNPSITQLAKAVQHLVVGVVSDDVPIGTNDRKRSLDDIVTHYSKFKVWHTRKCVLLTGATGFLGSHVLQQLLRENVVDKIYLLVRPGSLRKSREELSSVIPDSDPRTSCRLEFIEAELSQDDLGVNVETYRTLTAEIDTIIHLAWKVDFNHSLQSFEKEHLKGLRSIANLSLSSSRRPRIVYASSTAYAISWALAAGVDTIPEEILSNLDSLPCSDYGISKHLGERILQVAHDRYGIPVTVLRIGQIAGSSAGEFRPRKNTDWVQALITTSKTLSLIPSADIPIDWTPVDVVAGMVANAARADAAEAMEVRNIVHPKPVPWVSFTKVLQQELPDAKVSTLKGWVDAAEREDDGEPATLEKLPALKLKTFFRSLVDLNTSGQSIPGFATEKAMMSGERVQEMDSLDLQALVKRSCTS